jgi:hypothetical protein
LGVTYLRTNARRIISRELWFHQLAFMSFMPLQANKQFWEEISWIQLSLKRTNICTISSILKFN